MTSTARPTRTARGRTSRRRKVSTGVALLVGLFVGLIGLAPSAFAHHPNIEASAGCADGQHKISYRAYSWASTDDPQGRHDNIVIDYSVNGGAWANAGSGEFTEANDGSFSGSFTLPLATTGSVEVRATDVGAWGNGQSGGHPNYATVTLKSNCAPPADPSATASVDCPNDEIDLALTGKGSATTVDIFKDGVQVADNHPVPVDASSYSVDLAPEDENDTVVVRLDYAVGTDQTLNVVVNCDDPAEPSASVAWECGENAVVTLKNDGGEPITAVVTRNDIAVHAVVLAPGATTTREVLISADDEDQDVDIKVMFSDATATTDVTKTISVDCTTPEPHVGTPVCAANGILIPLTNTGTQSVTFTVVSPVLSPNPQDVVVPAGGSSSITLPVAEDATTSVSIKVGVQELYGNQALKRDCEKPAATVTFDCAAGGVVVKLTNAGPNPAIVPVGNENVTVPGNTTSANAITRVITVAEGAEYDVTVLGQQAKGVRDCEKPAATVVFDCAEGGVKVALSNSGSLPTTIKVNGTDHVIAAGGSKSFVVPVIEGAEYTVTVTGGDGLSKTATGTRDCENPAATVTFDCAAGGVVVKLTNDGALDTKVDVKGELVTVPAGTTSDEPVVRTIPVLEGAEYDVTVLGQQAKGVRDCEKPAATVVFDCAEGGVKVALSNSGSLPTTIKVNGTDHVIAAGGSKSFVVPVIEGAEYTVTVTGDGLSKTASGTRDCEKPAVTSAELDCAEGGVVVVLTNSGERDTLVTVGTQTVTVPKNGTKTVTIPVDEGAEYSVKIVGDGINELVSGTRDCENPVVVSAEVVCAEGGVVVELVNPDPAGADTTVTVNGEPVLVPAGTSGEAPVRKLVLVDENAAYTITVVGDELEETITGTRNCEQPEVDATQVVCAEGGVAVTLSNSGEADTTVMVGTTPVVVPAGSTARVVVPVEENAAYDFLVVGDELSQRVTGTLDCKLPELVVDEVVCAAGGLNVVLRNTGTDTGAFVVTSPALPGGVLQETVAAGASKAVLIPMGEDTSTTVRVTSGDKVLYDSAVTRDCEQVAGVQVTPQVQAAQAMPRTGSDVNGLLAAGFALLLAGMALVASSARRTEERWRT